MPAPAGPYELIAAAAGGLALFLLAMRMMTGGLRLFAGSALRRLLAGWTSTPLRGVATGARVTGAVESSSAVVCWSELARCYPQAFRCAGLNIYSVSVCPDDVRFRSET